MLRRLNIYFKEMFPLSRQIVLGLTLFFEIYFLVILTNEHFNFSIGISEFVGAFTIAGFLLFLRIADDFKDYEIDSKLFPERPLPSGRVTKKDLKIVLIIDIILMIVLNIIFMNNLYYFIFLMIYGTLMSVWFFSKTKIQKSLPLALITHNPIQVVINIYIMSFTCIKYGINAITYANLLVLFSLVWDGLIWEIARKTKAPEDETEYVTYSKLFGYKKVVRFIMIIMFFDLITESLLVMELFGWGFIGTVIGFVWLAWMCNRFIKTPKKDSMKNIMERYLYITELYVIILIISYLIFRI